MHHVPLYIYRIWKSHNRDVFYSINNNNGHSDLARKKLIIIITLIPLPELARTTSYNSLINDQRVFDGHVRFSQIATARRSRIMADMLATEIPKVCHVSAKDLTSLDSPLLSQHCKLSSSDKEIWDVAYGEEYFELVNLPCWHTIDEEEYKKLKPFIRSAIPTCAISTIKHNEKDQLEPSI